MRRTERKLEILESGKFAKSFDRAYVGLKGSIEDKIHYFVDNFRSNPKGFLLQYGRVKQCKKNRVLEIDVGPSKRLLADFTSNRLTLLDVGVHEIVPRYSDEQCEKDLSDSWKARDQFWPERRIPFFLEYQQTDHGPKYDEELSAGWLFFLEEQQDEVVVKIEIAIEDAIGLDDVAFRSFVIGGPGTGKTCVLLNLLERFARKGRYSVGMVLSDNVADYIKRSGRIDIDRYRVRLENCPSLNILLIDDPTYSQLTRALSFSKQTGMEGVVLGFDPEQLDTALSDSKFREIQKKYSVQTHRLSQCYRQKEVVGREAQRIANTISSSTPFKKTERIEEYRVNHAGLTSLANDFDFVNLGGYVKEYPNSSIADVELEVRRILRAPQWYHTAGLLIVLYECNVGERRRAFAPLRKEYIFEQSRSNMEDIKGPEWQHAFIFLKESLHQKLTNGFTGSGQKTYDKLRLLRIPFSRAKDSLVVFTIPDDA